GGRPFDVDVHAIPARPREPAHWHFDLRHLATTSETRLATQEAEAREARGVTLEEAGAARADGALLRGLEKARGVLREPPLPPGEGKDGSYRLGSSRYVSPTPKTMTPATRFIFPIRSIVIFARKACAVPMRIVHQRAEPRKTPATSPAMSNRLPRTLPTP